MLPLLYEINTRCWLRELSDECGCAITLGSVPDDQFDQWQRFGFTHLWLMGVWSTGPRARAQALAHLGLRQSYSDASPGWAEADVAGSPYAIADYHVAESLGGDAALEQELSRRGLDAYQPEYAKYTFCAICEPDDGWVTLLSNTLWPSEVIRRIRFFNVKGSRGDECKARIAVVLEIDTGDV